jgi:carbon-monoxide dehydrogenase large subunit
MAADSGAHAKTKPPFRRLEDPPLVRGSGRFVDDIHLPDMLHAVFVRSAHAHARINGIDAAAARAMPGVRAVLSLADIASDLTETKFAVGLPSPAYKQIVEVPVLADGHVRYVGEGIAVVLAETRYAAEDAAALVEVDYDPMPAVSDCRDALESGAPTVHAGAKDNLLATFGFAYGDVEGAFRNAPYVFRETLKQHRGCGQAIETRGLVAWVNPLEDRLTLWIATQMPHAVQRALVKVLGLDENRLRVIAPDIGGGFGPKLVVYPEYFVAAVAAKRLRRPIKWIEDRREHFLATTQERDQYWDVEIAVEADGRLRGVRGTMIHDHGAYTARGINLAQNAVAIMPGPYELPAYKLDVRIALTNKVPVTPVRGAGHPQGIFAMERLMDRVARELKLDKAEVRRRNLIPGAAMPYRRPMRTRDGGEITLDSGNFPACQAEALERAGYAAFRERQAAARREGRYLGIGIANYIKGTGRGPFESANVRISPSGRVSIYTGATAIGQSTRTMLAEIAAEAFGLQASDITVVAGDTSVIALGHGASASRQAVTAGSSTYLAAGEVRDKARKVAAHLMEAAEEDLEFVGGRVRVKGVANLSVTLADLANAVTGVSGLSMPGGLEPGLEATKSFMVEGITYPNGCHIAEVEVDPDTGSVTIARYVIVHDCGTMLNETLVDGQVLGGLAHGIGNALYERMDYDAGAQPQTTTLADYLVPSACEIPSPEISHQVSPTPSNPLGVKGVGESGTVPAAAALVSAIEDALAPFGVRIAETPIMPDRLVELIAEGREG